MAGLATAFGGSGSMTNSIHELDMLVTKIILSYWYEHHRMSSYYWAWYGEGLKHEVANWIVADPREIDITCHADVWLRLKPGTDVAFAQFLSPCHRGRRS